MWLRGRANSVRQKGRGMRGAGSQGQAILEYLVISAAIVVALISFTGLIETSVKETGLMGRVGDELNTRFTSDRNIDDVLKR